MRIVDRHGAFSIRKRELFARKGGRLQVVGADFFVVNDEVLATADLVMAIVNKDPYSTLSAARASIGRVVPDNNTEKTPPKSHWAAFSGPAAVRRGISKK